MPLSTAPPTSFLQILTRLTFRPAFRSLMRGERLHLLCSQGPDKLLRHSVFLQQTRPPKLGKEKRREQPVHKPGEREKKEGTPPATNSSAPLMHVKKSRFCTARTPVSFAARLIHGARAHAGNGRRRRVRGGFTGQK